MPSCESFRSKIRAWGGAEIFAAFRSSAELLILFPVNAWPKRGESAHLRCTSSLLTIILRKNKSNVQWYFNLVTDPRQSGQKGHGNRSTYIQDIQRSPEWSTDTSTSSGLLKTTLPTLSNRQYTANYYAFSRIILLNILSSSTFCVYTPPGRS